MPAGHPLARRRRALGLADLRGLDLVAYRVCRANAQVERHLRAHGVEPRVVLRAEDNLLLQGLVARGVGAALMPLLAVDREREDTVALAPRRGGAAPAHRAGPPPRPPRTPAAAAFAVLAREAAATLVPGAA